MIKIFNEQSDLLEFKKSNIYDFTDFDVIIIKFDFSTKCIIKANTIVCCELTASYINCGNITSISDITCHSLKANNIVCNILLSDYTRCNNIEAVEIKSPINISAFSICCNTILSFDIKCYCIKCSNCFTDSLDTRESDIKHMYTFDEYCI